jgi:endonuclease G
VEYGHVFSDARVAQEFLDRFPELTRGAAALPPGALESAAPRRADVDVAKAAVRNFQEGRPGSIDAQLEAIILRFGRPAYFVRDDTFDTKETPSSSQEVDSVVNVAKAKLNEVIPRVGRINLRNHRAPWVGTGWVVAPNVLVTNRHVAREFAERKGEEFVFVEAEDGRQARASLDTCREHGRSRENVFKLTKVLWIEPHEAGHPDVAFLEIDEKSEDDAPQPQPIALMPQDEYDALPVQRWLAVIGYPAQSPFNSAQDQQRIFEGVFDVKRLQPGLLTAKQASGTATHDATTLGGNSGSVVVDLETGQAVALHFGGIEGQTNMAVAAPVVARLLRERGLC